MAEILDISDGGVLRETANGIEVDRVAVVTNVAGPPDQYLKNALDTAGLPPIGDPNPMYPGLTCRGREASDDGCGNVRVRLIYGSTGNRSTLERQTPPASNSETARKNVAFSTASVKTGAARDLTPGGSGLVEPVFVQKPAGLPLGDTDPLIQRPELNFLKPLGQVVFERLELDPPLQRFRLCMGKVNSIAHGPYALHTLLCQNITAQTPNDGDWYQLRYQFTYDPDTWVVEVLWKYPSNSGSAPAPVDGESRKLYLPYDEIDFEAELGLDFSD